MKKILLLIMVSILSFSCTSQSINEVDKVEENSKTSYQLRLIVESNDKNSSLIYWDPVYGYNLIQENTYHTFFSKEPKFLIQYGSNNLSSFYIFENNDSLNLKNDKGYLVLTNLNKKKMAEIKFYSEFNRDVLKFKNEPFLVIRSLWQREYLMNPNLRDLYFEYEFKDNIKYLKNYKIKFDLDSNFYNNWYDYFKYKKFEKLLFTPVSKEIFNKISPNYITSLIRKKDSIINDKKLYLRPYQNTLLNLASTITKAINSREPTFFERYDALEGNFDGKSKYFIQKVLLDDETPFPNQADRIKKDKLIEDFIKNCPFEEYSQGFLKNMKFNEESFSNKKDNDFLVLSTNNSKQNIQKIIAKDTVCYLDIWASWCAPCIKEFPYSEILENEFKNSQVKFIYLSIDEKYNNWINMANRYNKTKNSFIELKSSNSISKQFKITEIPRYIIFDKTGKLVSSNAPRPSDPKLKEILTKLSH